MSSIKDIRDVAEHDLKKFARLVNPARVYGSIHDDVMDWWQSEDANDDQLLLLPRAHMKSHLAAVYAAWLVVKAPYLTILYISATADLAEKQLYAIKNILDSTVVARYWPELLHRDEGKREKWSAMEIAVDHPIRKAEMAGAYQKFQEQQRKGKVNNPGDEQNENDLACRPVA